MEKSPGNINITKLRAILLIEADFNRMNKIIFNSRVILSLETNQAIPYKVIGGRRGQLSLHVAMNKKLASNISN